MARAGFTIASEPSTVEEQRILQENLTVNCVIWVYRRREE